jgi:N-acetylglucosaminyldiphosphoundecaprenol N-acetyl-beta-D-mannosaminyltransferase
MEESAGLNPGDSDVGKASTLADVRTRVRIGKAWIDSLTFDQAIDAIEHLVVSGQGGSVFTPNVDHLVQLEAPENGLFREAYEAASLNLVDGQPLIWASYLLGSPLPEKVSGSDLIVPLVRRAEQRKWRVYFIGGAPGVGALAAEKLKAQYDVDIVGIESPMVSKTGEPADGQVVIERMAAKRPHLVFVAFGAPKQELFIQRALSAIRPGVAIGVGAGFDFIAGKMRRAPRWMSKSGLEWVFRLAQEPRRLAKRYLLDDPKFASILYRTLRDPKSGRIKRV